MKVLGKCLKKSNRQSLVDILIDRPTRATGTLPYTSCDLLVKGAASPRPTASVNCCTVPHFLSKIVKHGKAEANLVGENCVAKGAKRSKSVSIEESGHEAKKSRDDDNRDPNLAAQELCFKICKGLQRQIALIHEDMNKRTQRLFSTLDNERQTENERLKQKLIETEKKLLETKSKMNAEMAAGQHEQVLGASHVDSHENSGDAGPGECLSAKHLEKDPQNVTQSALQHKVDELPGPPSMPGVTDATQEKGAGREEDSIKAEASKSPDPSDDDLSADLSISNIVGAENVACKGFQMLSEAPPQHQFFKKESQPSNPRTFRNSVRKEMKLFQSSLPDGIFVHGFEDRLDLFSVMILGPCGTPYEDAVFLFDLMLPNDYPTSPPTCHYHSYCTDRLNPNLYEDGKVCVSLLGTWSGKGNEMWTCKSNMLQVLVSIQGLILVREPYYNEAGFERQRGTQVGEENSRVYNEMAVLKTCQSLTRMCQRLPGTFKEEIQNYLLSHGPRMISRLDKWMEMSQSKKPTSLDAASVLSGIEKTQSLSQMSPHQNSQITDTHIDKSIQADPPETTLLKDNLLEAVAQSDKQEDCVNRSQGTMGNMSDKLSDLSLEKRKDTNACGLEETDPSLASPDNKGANGGSGEFSEPEFPLFPMSKGFCITLRNHLRVYKKTLEQLAQQASAAGSVSAEDAV